METLANGHARQILDEFGRPVGGTRPDDLALPHVVTFSGLLGSAYQTYFHEFDQARRRSREDALAMEQDPFLMRLMDERAEGTVSLKWHVEADNPKDPVQKACADGLTRIAKATPRLRRLCRNLLRWAVWRGRQGAQLRWVWRDLEVPSPTTATSTIPGSGGPGVMRVRALKVLRHQPVNGDKIGYTWRLGGGHDQIPDDVPDGTPYVRISGGQTDNIPGARIISMTEGRAALLTGPWRERFLIHQHQPEDVDFDHPELAGAIGGRGVRSVIAFFDYLRKEYIGWAVDTLERTGLGVVVVKFPQGNAAAKTEAVETAKKFSRRSVLVLPVSAGQMGPGGAVEVVEGPVSGIEMVIRLQERAEDCLERYIVGQGMSGGDDSDGSLGGSGRARFAHDTKHLIIRADAEEEAETLTGSEEEPGLLSTIYRWTYPGLYAGGVPCPRWVWEIDTPDKGAALEAAKTFVDMGGSVVEDEVRGLVGLSKPTDDDEILGGKEALAAAQAAKAGPMNQANAARRAAAGGGEGGEDDADPFADRQDADRFARPGAPAHYAGHDVSGEPRDQGGRWAAGGGKGKGQPGGGARGRRQAGPNRQAWRAARRSYHAARVSVEDSWADLPDLHTLDPADRDKFKDQRAADLDRMVKDVAEPHARMPLAMRRERAHQLARAALAWSGELAVNHPPEGDEDEHRETVRGLRDLARHALAVEKALDAAVRLRAERDRRKAARPGDGGAFD